MWEQLLHNLSHLLQHSTETHTRNPQSQRKAFYLPVYEREGSSFKKICKMLLKRKKEFSLLPSCITPVMTNHFWGHELCSCFDAVLFICYGFFCFVFPFSSKRLKRVNTRFKETRLNKGTRISQIHSLCWVKYTSVFLYFHCYFLLTLLSHNSYCMTQREQNSCGSFLVPKLFLLVTLPTLEKCKSFLYRAFCESH